MVVRFFKVWAFVGFLLGVLPFVGSSDALACGPRLHGTTLCGEDNGCPFYCTDETQICDKKINKCILRSPTGGNKNSADYCGVPNQGKDLPKNWGKVDLYCNNRGAKYSCMLGADNGKGHRKFFTEDVKIPKDPNQSEGFGYKKCALLNDDWTPQSR